MRHITRMVFVTLVCTLLTGCQAKQADGTLRKNDGSLSLIVATDIHYLSPELTDYGAAFSKMMAKADGKMTQYAPQITDAFLSEVMEARPDALILSGDLTFNGEKQSHLDLAKKLSALEKQGIAVLLLPGNHDIRHPFSFSYIGDQTATTPNISSEEFEEIYQNTGYEKALSRDDSSLSYVYALSDKVRILLLDANAVEAPGSIPEATLSWAKEQLQDARDAGSTVISVTHQNVLIHNDLLIKNYVLKNYRDVNSLLIDSGVPLNLSGHIHVQHISEKEGFYDAATGSLAVYPHQYGVVEITPEQDISYITSYTDVSGWAAKNGETSPELLNFTQTSMVGFDTHTSGSLAAKVEYLEGLTPEQTEAMKQFITDVNRMYFAGTLWEQREELKTEESWKLFEAAGEDFFLTEYLDSMMSGGSRPDNSLVITHQ